MQNAFYILSWPKKAMMRPIPPQSDMRLRSISRRHEDFSMPHKLVKVKMPMAVKHLNHYQIVAAD
jgi:hypothetical protein